MATIGSVAPVVVRLIALVAVSVGALSVPASAVATPTSQTAPTAPTSPTAPTAPTSPTGSGISILFIGNSHTRANDLPGTVATLVEADSSGVPVVYEVAPGYQFLDERLDDAASNDLLESRAWTYVVLQAQRYSSSGTVDYSTTEAEEWVRRVRSVGAVPILFPEWPRRGIDESTRIFDLHVSIAAAEAACVPPIPQAFDLAPGSVTPLHATDGNHASPTGSLLAALVLTHTMTGQPLDHMPDLTSIDVDPLTQHDLRAAAAEAVAATSPWTHCPGDRPAALPTATSRGCSRRHDHAAASGPSQSS